MARIPGSVRLSTLVLLAVSGIALDSARAGGLEPFEYTMEDGTVFRFSGQINMGVLSYDDGQDTYTNFVDNDNSSSRVRFQMLNTTGDWKYEAVFEAEYQPLASNVVSQLNDTPNWDFPATNIRKAEVAFWNEDFGKLWLGQGSMASDGSAEVDNSGTSVVAYSSLSDTAGGYFFRMDDGTLSSITVGSAFSNLDGLGRKLRVRYDTPMFNGFGLRTSYGEDAFAGKNQPLYDVAAVYAGGFEAVDLDGAIAYSRNDGTDVDIVSGSISGLHKASGISLTFAAAKEFTDGLEGYYGYGKLGYQHAFFDVGITAFSIDYYYGRDLAASDSSGSSIGLAAVQYIDDWNMQLWALYRNFDYADNVSGYDDGQTVFGGALVKF